MSRKKTGTPARTPARSSRKATRATRLESASDLKPEILNFDQEVEKTLKKPVQKVMESDKETVSESDTDNEIRSRLGQGQMDTDAEIRSRLGNVVEVEDEISKGGRRNRKSSINSIDEDRGKEVSYTFVNQATIGLNNCNVSILLRNNFYLKFR